MLAIAGLVGLQRTHDVPGILSAQLGNMVGLRIGGTKPCYAVASGAHGRLVLACCGIALRMQRGGQHRQNASKSGNRESTDIHGLKLPRFGTSVGAKKPRNSIRSGLPGQRSYRGVANQPPGIGTPSDMSIEWLNLRSWVSSTSIFSSPFSSGVK